MCEPAEFYIVADFPPLPAHVEPVEGVTNLVDTPGFTCNAAVRRHRLMIETIAEEEANRPRFVIQVYLDKDGARRLRSMVDRFLEENKG